MCGIAGYLLGAPAGADPRQLERLLQPLRRRGPDDEGIALVHRRTGVLTGLRTDRTTAGPAAAAADFRAAGGTVHDLALLHARFAVMDDSPDAHQPFVSGDGSAVAVFNGSIFNYIELRDELCALGVRFRTASDTEVLVEGYRQWGDGVWHRLNGFWAVALWDSRSRSLVLCRDRFGTVPLYLRRTGGHLFFASLLEPLRNLGAAAAGPDETVVSGFIETGIKDFGRRTFLAGIDALPAGSVLRCSTDGSCVEERYWSPPTRPLTDRDLAFPEAVRLVRDTLFDAVSLRMRAAVPLAFELSGGIDSGAVLAAAASQQDGLVSYTLAASHDDEEPIARAMTRRYNLDYRVLRVEHEDFGDDALAFAALMEEPYHAPNVLTHYRMRQRMKADGIDVALCGSGGDEVFAGYDTEFWPAAYRELRASGHRRTALSGELFFRLGTPARARDAAWSALKWPKRTGLGLLRRLQATASDGGDDRSDRATGAAGAVAMAAAVPDGDWREMPASELASLYARLPLFAQRRYHVEIGLLPHYLATDDRFTMSIPLEQRNPFLDYRLVELGLALPPQYLFRHGWTKYVLRCAMAPYLPRSIVWRRRKRGFPLHMRGFLQAQRQFLAPFSADYDALLHRSPARLWRVCSTALWRQALGAEASARVSVSAAAD